MEYLNKEIEKTVKNIFNNKAGKNISPPKLEKQNKIKDLAGRLFDFIPSVCWMTESHMAEKLGTSERQIKYAKAYLLINNLITIKLEGNSNRPNHRHYIYKNSTAQECGAQEKAESSALQSKIKWEIFNELSPADFSCMTIEEQLDIYEEMNLPFIPLHFPKFKKDMSYCSCPNGRNCPFIGKHPAVFFKGLDFSKKSTYKKMKSHWIERDNRFNIGFLTNDFAVIDVDFRHGGQYSLETLEEIYGEFPRNLTVSTGNGFHIYLDSLMPSKVKLLKFPGIDVRSKGGYVVAPGSQHRLRKFYEWQSLSVPESLPDAFLNAVQKKPTESSVKTDINKGDKLSDKSLNTFGSDYIIPDGERNDTLFRIASRERGRGRDYDEISRIIKSINAANCKPPLSENEVLHIAKNVSSRFVPNVMKGLEVKP
jgi:hypothetical protein